MIHYCFVCLNKTKNKVCIVCKCYAHPKCWGEYLKNFTNIFIRIHCDKVVIGTPFYTKCPQCRGNIGNVKPITRSDTHIARRISLCSQYCKQIFRADITNSKEEKEYIFKNIFDLIIRNKQIIKKEEIFKDILREKLQFLYKNDNWKPANLYHNRIFGEQII